MVWGKNKAVKRQDITEENFPEEQVVEEDEEEYKPKRAGQLPPLSRLSQPIQQKKVWELTEVPTQTAIALVNNKTGKVLDLYSAVAELLNRTED
jgi:hypothetical protein